MFYSSDNTSGFILNNGGAGICKHIKSESRCEAAARVLGLSDNTAVDDGQNNGVPYDPPFCYFEGGSLMFNNGANTGSCSLDDYCLCEEREEIRIMSTTNGILTSPSYPQVYPNDADCFYIIKQPTLSFFKLHFHSMDIVDECTPRSSPSQCPSDFLEIRYGLSESSYPLTNLSGSNIYEGIHDVLFLRCAMILSAVILILITPSYRL